MAVSFEIFSARAVRRTANGSFDAVCCLLCQELFRLLIMHLSDRLSVLCTALPEDHSSDFGNYSYFMPSSCALLLLHASAFGHQQGL